MAATLNKVMLIGRLGADPEIRYMQNGTAVANIRMATDESYRDRETGQMVDKAEWHKIVVFGRQAETCQNYLRKGSLIFLEGSLQTREWQDQQGNRRWTTEVKAQRVQFLDTRGGAGAQQGAPGQGGYAPQEGPQGGPQGGYAPQQQQQPPQQQFQDGGQQQSGPDEDLGPAFPSEASGMDDVPF